MSATVTNWLAVTATPLFVSVPAPGSVVIFTAASVFAGLSFASPNPKSDAVNTYAVSATAVTVLSVPVGASFTDVTVTVSDWFSVLKSLTPFVWPLSVTVHVIEPVPFASPTVLYFSPCSSVAVSVAFASTGVTPSALNNVTNVGIPVIVYVST